MKFLTLLRHAKAMPVESADAAALDDVDRPLTQRGRLASAWVGQSTRDRPPDLILCSPSVRTVETLRGLLEVWPKSPPALLEPEIYLAEASTLLARLARVPDDVGDVWVLGHNPGLHDLALQLAGGVPSQGPGRELAFNFPTAGRVRLAGDILSWQELPLATWAIETYEVPPRG